MKIKKVAMKDSILTIPVCCKFSGEVDTKIFKCNKCNDPCYLIIENVNTNDMPLRCPIGISVSEWECLNPNKYLR